jgi:pyruvate kinase
MWVTDGARPERAATLIAISHATESSRDSAQVMTVDEISSTLRDLRDELRRAADDPGAGVSDPSVANMRAYLALRRQDNRALQGSLARLGLSSLGRSEGHVLATVEQVLGLVERLDATPPIGASATHVSFEESSALLRRRVGALFGEDRANRETRIMVTLPSEAATDGELVGSLVTAGMDCARINSAHDDEPAWAAMTSHVQAAGAAAGRHVPVLVDLPGPKLRTGSIEPGPEVVHLRPSHDELGVIVSPARAWLAAAGSRAVPQGARVVLPVPAVWLEALSTGDRIAFVDTRGRQRELRVGAGSAEGRWVETERGAYLVSGMALTSDSAGDTRIGRLPPRPSSIPLAVGDTLRLTRDRRPGRARTRSSPARISCTLPEVFDAVAVGDSIWLDDGKFGGVARRVTRSAIEVEITQAPPGGGRLRAEKGINVPDTTLSIASSHAVDAPAIAFAVAHADMLGLSFVSTRVDVRAAADALVRCGGGHLGLILKIETRAGFDALPELLTEALMRDAPCGVMIARGDLAIEVGWERLAEVQEEILWLCEAAHVPVVWATQVLDTLARTGIASRAEITDAASGARAECVMLNKGPMIVAAIVTLDDILARMASHRHKKTSLLRRLRAWTPEAAT